jgi:hypothetical protein
LRREDQPRKKASAAGEFALEEPRVNAGGVVTASLASNPSPHTQSERERERERVRGGSRLGLLVHVRPAARVLKVDEERIIKVDGSRAVEYQNC